MTQVIRTLAELRPLVRGWRAAGEQIGVVPTMGALHEGHLSLARAAKKDCQRVVTTIFVNPMQFGPNEDFNHYPRTPSRDSELLTAAGCDLLFEPDAKEIYPLGHLNATRIDVPGLTDILLALATRLGVEDGDEDYWDALPEDDPRTQVHHIYQWLGFLQETLIHAAR